MFVKVKSGGKFYFVKISEPGSEDFTPNEILLSSKYYIYIFINFKVFYTVFFLYLVIAKLQLEVESEEILLKDRDGATIPFDELAEIISQYKYSSWFFVEICFEATNPSNTNFNLKKVNYKL